MKIEMGESLMMSYLKHVKNCMLYQTNWKIAKSWKRTEDADKKAKELFKKIKEKLEFSFVIETDFEQTLQQAEIDAIGIDCSGKVYFVDVAFHEAGLNYGSKEETNKRVMKKFLRTYMAALAYFPEYKYEIIFASPKVNPAVNEIISQFFNSMKNDFSDENVEFKYIANENFRNEILIPTIKEANLNSDTAELFMRSIKMLELFEMVNFTEDKTEETPVNIPHFDIPLQSTNNQSRITRNTSVRIPVIKSDKQKIILNGIEIPIYRNDYQSVQDFIKQILTSLFNERLLSENEIRLLQDKSYSKTTFDINFPLLEKNYANTKDNAGHPRYWENFRVNGFYVCSQWQKKNFSTYDRLIANWLMSLENK